MNGTAARFLRLGIALAGIVTLGWVLTSQASKPAKHRISLPTDWSHRHLIFSRPGSPEQAALVGEDPRYWQQVYRRDERLTLPETGTDLGDAESVFSRLGGGKKLHRDWSENLGTGGGVGAGNFPAKFSFDITKANCGSATTPDYVVFSTGLQSSGTQASIVAYDNLYSGCTGTVPSTYWAYDTTDIGPVPGTIKTSPIISKDGSQVAFVQTDGSGHGTLVLLKWAANMGTVALPAAPTNVGPAAYAACAANCMTTFDLRTASNVQTDDTTSSVFYDYGADIAWVGDSFGLLHKFHPFFSGTPAELRTAPWPVPVNAGQWISSPVYDHISQNIFVGDAQGILYRVDPTLATVTASHQLDFGTGIVEAPIVDAVHGLVYVFASSDGSTACTGGPACAAVFQLPVTFLATSTGSKVTVGPSTVFTGLTPNPMYIGDFDSTYFNSANATGNLYVCGNTVPTLYKIPITAGGLPGSSVAVTTLATTGSKAACSPVTDIPNPNATGGLAEWLFVSTQTNGVGASCSFHGCLFDFVDTPWQASTAYTLGQRILGSNFRIETVITAGTSGLTQPTWGFAAGRLRTDGGVVWISQGLLSALAPSGWLATNAYAIRTRILDSNGNIEVVAVAGTSGTAPPTWSTTPGGTTPDGSVTWRNAGLFGTSAIGAEGGASGIVIDNLTNGTPAGTSQMYFSTLSNQLCGASGAGGCAVQASQSALQ